MFKKIILESFLQHHDFSNFLEDYDAKNYMSLQRLYVLPVFAKMYGYENPEEFFPAEPAAAQEIMSLFKEVVIEMFGHDSAQRPNSEISDDPRWDVNSEGAKDLAMEIVGRIKDKMQVPAAAEE